MLDLLNIWQIYLFLTLYKHTYKPTSIFVVTVITSNGEQMTPCVIILLSSVMRSQMTEENTIVLYEEVTILSTRN